MVRVKENITPEDDFNEYTGHNGTATYLNLKQDATSNVPGLDWNQNLAFGMIWFFSTDIKLMSIILLISKIFLTC